MSSGGSRGNPGKGGSNKTKPNKSDSKTDKTDLNLKPQIKPTAEQMQLAKIIDSHRTEDPELREKIKQVMEITRVSEDEACMALHSREYDTAQAITLLTDGSGPNLSSEWEQAGKKKKPKAPAPKSEAPRGKDAPRDRSEKRDGRDKSEKGDKKEVDSSESQITTGSDLKKSERGERGGRGAARRGGRGRGGITRTENKENDEVNGNRGGFAGRSANGPTRGGRGAGSGRGRGAVRDGSRTFASRARGGREDDSSGSSIGMWMNSQAEAPAEKPPLKVGEWNGFPPAEDWDNEEYTGSLQETKVFTPSVQNPGPAPLLEQSNGVAPAHLNNVVAASGVESKISAGGSGDGVVDSSNVNSMSSVAAASTNIVPGQSINLSMLLPKASNTPSGAPTNPGANILASLQSSYATGNQVVVGNSQAMPPRHKVQRPQGPVSKIPSSAVEMPVDSVTTLDVKFGGLDFDDNSSLSFGPVIHGGSKPSTEIMYNSTPNAMDGYATSDKDNLNKTVPPQASSPFQNQRNSQSAIVESGSGASGVPISPNIDSMGIQAQKANSSPQSSYANPPSAPSAFANYTKVVPGYPVAPGFAPVSIPAPGTATYSNSAAGNTGSPGAATATSFISNTPSTYHAMGLGYGANQPVATAVPAQPISSQPLMTPVSQNATSYPGSATQPQTGYSNATAASNYSSAAGAQYSSYGSKMNNSLNSQNSAHSAVKDNETASAPSSASASNNLSQMGSMQQGSGIPPTTGLPPTSSTNPKLSTASNIPGGKMEGAKIGIPPGMMMQPQYILNPQSGVPAFYQLQAPFYGFPEEQPLLRMPPHIPGYYDTSAANYGNPMSFTLEAGAAGGPGVSGRNDGSSIPNYSAGTDSRFPRSDSSTASPVPSNIAGQNTQQPLYNPAVPGYYFVGNNMMHPGHFQYGPPPTTYLHPTSAIVTPTNPTNASHAGTSTHQYPKKGNVGMYAQPFYDGSQQATDYGKNSYSGGPGQNSNSGKSTSATSTGSSQSTDYNSSTYSKGPLKMNSYEKSYVNAGGYNSIGGGSNNLNSPIGGAGLGGPQYVGYIQPVQTLPLAQDGNNASRQGAGQPPGSKQYGGPGAYWSS